MADAIGKQLYHQQWAEHWHNEDIWTRSRWQQQGPRLLQLVWQLIQEGSAGLLLHLASGQRTCRLGPHTWGRQGPPHPHWGARHQQEGQPQHLQYYLHFMTVHIIACYISS